MSSKKAIRTFGLLVSWNLLQIGSATAGSEAPTLKLGLVAIAGYGLQQQQFTTPFGTLIATPGMTLGGGPAGEIGPLSAELIYVSRYSSSTTTSGVQFGAGSTASIHIPVMGRISLSPQLNWGAGAYYEMSMETGGSATLGLVTGPRLTLMRNLFIDGRILMGIERREGADRVPIEAQVLVGINVL